MQLASDFVRRARQRHQGSLAVGPRSINGIFTAGGSPEYIRRLRTGPSPRCLCALDASSVWRAMMNACDQRLCFWLQHWAAAPAPGVLSGYELRPLRLGSRVSMHNLCPRARRRASCSCPNRLFAGHAAPVLSSRVLDSALSSTSSSFRMARIYWQLPMGAVPQINWRRTWPRPLVPELYPEWRPGTAVPEQTAMEGRIFAPLQQAATFPRSSFRPCLRDKRWCSKKRAQWARILASMFHVSRANQAPNFRNSHSSTARYPKSALQSTQQTRPRQR